MSLRASTLHAIAATILVVLSLAMIYVSAARAEDKLVLIGWLDVNETRSPIECGTLASGLASYQSMPQAENPDEYLAVISQPAEWECTTTRCRFIGGLEYEHQKSGWSNEVLRPTGCEMVEYVPEPTIPAAVAAGVLMLGLMSRGTSRSTT